ncbi:SGNH/GDSL hydrolase family protein [Streptomyces xiamenensis]|uniref:SGNH/GDSL hydrolase family protein n=1 Tax=Streptomyces xiamenensis TaxID=408015 RepID=UPI0036EA15CB
MPEGATEQRPKRKRLLTRKRVLITGGALLAVVLGAGALVGYLTFVRPPANPPAVACADGRPQGADAVVVAAGASMTQGTLGRDWVGDLRTGEGFGDAEFVNAGVNGDTSSGLLRRTDSDIVACRPDAVIVLVGTNDVRDEVPVAEYGEHLAAIVERVRSQTSARVALMSLPPLGEDLDAEINQRLHAYNDTIRRTAEAAGADYLPLYEEFAERLADGTPRPAYAFGFPTAYLAASEHYLLGRSWDEVARSRGLEYFVDHIHLSDRGGEIVADLAARWLLTQAMA